jgi:hypothetical protein
MDINEAISGRRSTRDYRYPNPAWAAPGFVETESRTSG